MTTYLLKTEPDAYSYDDLVREKSTVWDGVRNNQALIHLRAMRKGDEAFIYHTGNEKRIAGLAKVTSDAFEDPTDPGTNAKDEPKWAVVKLTALRAAKKQVTLKDIKADARFNGFDLVRLPRLSVMPVPEKLDKTLRELAGL
jgi:predicted RNA-binding protein with PUA-like domain